MATLDQRRDNARAVGRALNAYLSHTMLASAPR
jgi:hypothetical protein